MVNKNIFIKKKFLIYGLGKSGLSTYFFLKKYNEVYLYDDYIGNIKNLEIKKKISKLKKIVENKFDYIVISPGINTNNCKLNKFLKKNKKIIINDLDIFYKFFFRNKNITITGTNGKSTTSKILYELLKNQKKDVRLTGNIGNPILSEKKITSKTIFVIEASSYQIEYSKYFKANYALILNISPDHLDRHGTFNNYIKSKFKLFLNQEDKDFSFLNKQNKYLKKFLKKKIIKSNLIDVKIKSIHRYLKNINNSYFKTDGNKQNLSFIFAVAKKLNIKKKHIISTINSFKGLEFRQQIIYQSKKFTLINDSKSTSYSSSVNILKSLKRVYWIIGGIPKVGDKFLMKKKECLNFRCYIFGKNKKLFINQLKNKINYQSFNNLKESLKKIIYDIKIDKDHYHKTILFSPSAASFDEFKNFEDRGKRFNFLIKNLKFKKLINV